MDFPAATSSLFAARALYFSVLPRHRHEGLKCTDSLCWTTPTEPCRRGSCWSSRRSIVALPLGPRGELAPGLGPAPLIPSEIHTHKSDQCFNDLC
jgi:hypothetical protein